MKYFSSLFLGFILLSLSSFSFGSDLNELIDYIEESKFSEVSEKLNVYKIDSFLGFTTYQYKGCKVQMSGITDVDVSASIVVTSSDEVSCQELLELIR